MFLKEDTGDEFGARPFADPVGVEGFGFGAKEGDEVAERFGDAVILERGDGMGDGGFCPNVGQVDPAWCCMKQFFQGCNGRADDGMLHFGK